MSETTTNSHPTTPTIPAVRRARIPVSDAAGRQTRLDHLAECECGFYVIARTLRVVDYELAEHLADEH